MFLLLPLLLGIGTSGGLGSGLLFGGDGGGLLGPGGADGQGGLGVGGENPLSPLGKVLGTEDTVIGSEQQKDIAKKIKYIFIVGDLVDGCGIYPEQDKELLIKDVYQQYKECAELLKQIPKHIPLIICPGNHDALHAGRNALLS